MPKKSRNSKNLPEKSSDIMPTIVFIHGFGGSTLSWKYQKGIGNKYPTILLDLPGHGKSGSDRDEITIRTYANDIAHLLNSFDLNNVILVGWSMGGPIILETSLMVPDRVLGLVTVDSLIPNVLYIGTSPAVKQALLGPFIENDFSDAYIERVIEPFLSDNFNPTDVEELKTQATKLKAEPLLKALASLIDWDYREIIEQIDHPLRLIIAVDELNDNKHTMFKEHFDKNSIVPVEGVDHFIQIENPSKFNHILLREISKLLEEAT